MYFERSVERVLNIEGLFSDHKDDPGGKTWYGITEATARAEGMAFPPTKAQAIAFYRRLWDRLKGDDVSVWSPGLAERIFDAEVNCGNRGARWFQRVLNCMNSQERLYQDLTVDGKIGPKTLQALGSYCKAKRDPDVIRRAVRGFQAEHYLSLCERDRKFESFVYGWFLQRID